jgi:DNA-binding NarL/FixJ family response regulator
MDKKRLIILEDCQLLCNGLREWLKDEPGYQIILQTGDWTEFRKKEELHQHTNVISTFHWILKHPGFKAFNEFFRQHPLINVVCLEDGAPNITFMNTIDTSVCGVINLTSDKKEFLSGVREIVNDGIYASRRMPATGSDERIGDLFQLETDPPLTKREEDILNFISLGFSDSEIAETLLLGPQIIREYRTALGIRMGTGNPARRESFALEVIHPFFKSKSLN